MIFCSSITKRQYQWQSYLLSVIISCLRVVTVFSTLILAIVGTNIKAQTPQCFQLTEQQAKKQSGKTTSKQALKQGRHIDQKVWQQLTQEQQCYLLQLTELRLQNDLDHGPFNYSINNQPSGFSVDFMAMIASKLGIKITFVSDKLWHQYIQHFQDGKLDALINVAVTEPRKQWLNYTKPYIQISYTMATHQSSQINFKNFDRRSHYRIATITQSETSLYSRLNFTNSTIVAYDNLEQAIEAVVNQEADFFIYAGAVIKHHLEKNNITELKLITPPKAFRDTPLRMAIATAKENPLLRDIIDVAINNISASQIIHLRNKWHIVESKTTSLGLSKEQLNYLNQLQQLTVGGLNNNKPINFVLNNKPQGYAIDIINNIGATLGVKINYIQDDRASLVTALQERKIDILLNASAPISQPKTLKYTQPYLTQRNILVSAKKPAPTQWIHFNQLTNKTLAVIKDNPQHQLVIRNAPKTNFLQVNNQQLAIEAILSGQADATIMSESSIENLNLNSQSNRLQYQLLNMPNYNSYDTHALALHQDNKMLYSIIEKALAAIPNKRMQAIKKQWFNNQIPVNLYESALSYKQRQWLLENPHLSLHLPNWHLPLGGASPDKHHGILAELTSYMQQQINYQWLTATQHSPHLSKKANANIVVTTADNPEFKHTHILSNPIHKTPIVMLTSNPQIKLLTSKQQISTLKLGVFNHPPLPAKLFSQYIQSNYQSFNDMNAAIEALQDNQLDILFCPMSLCTYYMNAIDDKSIRIVGQTNYHQKIVFAVERRFMPMVDIINDTLENISAQHKNATYQRWNYQLQPADTNNREVLHIIAIALVFLATGLAIIDYLQGIEKARETEQHAKSIQEANQELTRAQSKLIAAEKMAALGALTAGIAHEINNPTNSVHLGVENLEFEIEKIQQFFIDLASEEVEEGLIESFREQFAPLFEHVHTIVDGTSRIKTIVEDLRAFTRLDGGEKKLTKINDIMLSTINLIKAKYKHNTEFITQFANLPEIAIHSGQLNQVFMNLLVNACDAIEEAELKSPPDAPHRKGKIIVTTALQNQQLFIIVQDNGCGMSEQTCKKIFEPFYTTKPVGKGTGLGMAISFGIIKDHGGSMNVCSTVNLGTTISIIMPITN